MVLPALLLGYDSTFALCSMGYISLGAELLNSYTKFKLLWLFQSTSASSTGWTCCCDLQSFSSCVSVCLLVYKAIIDESLQILK